MAYITVGTENSADIELYYTDQGSGQPVVLIHGFPLNGESWGKQQAALLDAGYRVIAYDRRGFGASTQDRRGLRLRHVRRRPPRADGRPRSDGCRARRLLDGHRRGRALPRRATAPRGWRRPRSSARSSRSCSSPTTTPTAPAPQEFFDGIAAAVRADRYAFVAGFFGDFYNLDENLGTRISQEAVDASDRRGATTAGNAAIAAAPLTWPTDFRGDLAAITVPTLILHGTADRILPIDTTARQIPGAAAGRHLRRDRRRAARPAVDARRRGERGAAGVPRRGGGCRRRVSEAGRRHLSGP